MDRYINEEAMQYKPNGSDAATKLILAALKKLP